MDVHAVEDLHGKGVVDRPHLIELNDRLSIQFNAKHAIGHHMGNAQLKCGQVGHCDCEPASPGANPKIAAQAMSLGQ